MLIEANNLTNASTLSADVCIIGSGPAGLTVARQLGDARVVLLESGGYYPETRTQNLARGDIAAEEYWSLETGRLRCFGGTSGHWTGWCRPLDPLDLAERPWVEHGRWPLSWDELAPYYQQAQPICDLGAFDYDPEAWSRRLNLPLLPLAGTSAQSCLWQFSRPTRFGEKYRNEIAESTNVTAYLHANVTALNTSRSDRRVNEVEVACFDGPRFKVRARVFVLAAGGLENPRILLASASPRGLGNANGLVGRYFLEHLHSVVGVLCCDPGDKALQLYHSVCNVPSGLPVAVQATLGILPEVQRSEELLNLSMLLEPLTMPLPFRPYQAESSLSLARQLHYMNGQPAFNLSVRAEQLPAPESRLRLGFFRDELGVPKPVLEWRHHPKTLRSIRRSVELIAEAIGHARVGRVYSYIHGQAAAPRVWPQVFGGHHHMGTTRMHEDARFGVVDRDCRVHSLENLYVAGSSVFPSAGHANPTLTIVALATRLAETLRTRAL